MNHYDEFFAIVLGIILALVFFFMLTDCSTQRPKCTVGISDDARYICCRAVCEGKDMNPYGHRRSSVNPDEDNCTCIQKDEDNRRQGKGYLF